MGFEGGVWKVRGRQEAIGEIVIEEADFPCLSGSFTPGPGFADVQDLFARELVLAEDEDWEAWGEVHDEIRRQVSLISPDGPVPEFLLHIEGDRAGFRWSDEPFDDV
ncbi:MULTISPECIES: hypothetical protein [unclassified Streptomyces]|uniref:hypothetical protein n=1 Tax=unclassified Streptomyces TaxID=2593676 RepID=UPI003449B9D1